MSPALIPTIVTGKLVLKNKSNDVNSVCYSPDGRYLASGNSDCSIKIWKIESGAEIKTLKNLGNIVNAHVS